MAIVSHGPNISTGNAELLPDTIPLKNHTKDSPQTCKKMILAILPASDAASRLKLGPCRRMALPYFLRWRRIS